jgi:ferric-dicitrate binding protein FerR (iron transport regulator)
MITDPKLAELLAPLAGPEDDLALRRLQVDREKILSRMMEVSRAPERRFASRARVAAGFALAASFALVGWGGARLWQRHAHATTSSIEVVAQHGELETSPDTEAHIETSAGMEVELMENAKISLDELGAAGVSSTLRLDRGRVRCVIPHQPGRTFSVVTAAARVVDVGTIFSVSVEQSASGPRTVVHVEDGEVRVEFRGGQSRLTASQSWVSGKEPTQPAAEAMPADVAVKDLPATQSARHDRIKLGPETLAAEASLLRSGLASEQKGELRAAVAAFETLVTRYPDSQLAPDARVALARVKGRLENAQ